jgi:hypothetical protein
MSDPITEYREAFRSYENVRASAHRMINFMHDAAAMLRLNPAYFMYQQYGLPLPPAHQPSQGARSFDMSAWPDAQQLQTVLSDWRKAFAKLHATWEAIPQSDRTGPGLSAPPQMLS